MTCLGVTGEVSRSKQFQWKIPDFLSLSTDKNAFYSSPTFMFDSTSLHLIIYPGGHKAARSSFFSVFMVNETDCPLDTTYSLHIKKADGTLSVCNSNDVFLKIDWGYRDFYDRSYLERNKSKLVPSGILTIICVLTHKQDGRQGTTKTEKEEMRTSESLDYRLLTGGSALLKLVPSGIWTIICALMRKKDGKQATTKTEKEEMRSSESSDYRLLTELDVLSENLRDLSANKDSCDVVLEVEDKEFKAHKAILMARSSVFAAMFQHDMLEKQTGIVKIPDCDSESFQAFLDYLYCGKLRDVTFRSAFRLYSTSCKYDVHQLKEFCIEYLIQSLSPDNMCNVVKFADKYDEAKLITGTQDFFNENWNRIFPTTSWQSFMQNNFRLANKLLIEFSKTKDS